ncbi:Sedlin, N-terminal conserved region-domain-containing protein [Kalaharituber pfeilii]|nr:Sedlin, N-terminal conserved region-domain-containing protein [Kalaharituber pfeilii]
MQPPPVVSRITCISIVGKQNNPLHIAVFSPPNAPRSADPDPSILLNYHFLTHTTLDIFALRLPQKTADQDFGLLYAVSEDLAAYGWLTNTGVKFVVFVSCVGVGGGVREGELRPVFKELQTAYIALVCNPFYDNDNVEKKPIKSKKFIAEVKRIGESWVPSSALAAAGSSGSEFGSRDVRRDVVI